MLAGILGALAKSDAQAIHTSQDVARALSRLESSTTNGADASLGITFLMVMIVTMAYVASAVSSIRNEEARGYLDNLLVRSVGRAPWLTGRVVLVAVVTILAGSMGGVLAWVGTVSQGGIPPDEWQRRVDRMALALSVPARRAAMLDEFTRTMVHVGRHDRAAGHANVAHRAHSR